MRIKLKNLELTGFRSFDSSLSNRDANTVDFGDVTILLGANGSGKSNLIKAFTMLNYGLTGSLAGFFRTRDPQSFFYKGPQRTPTCRLALGFESDDGIRDGYEVNLAYGVGGMGRVLVTGEEVFCRKPGLDERNQYRNHLRSLDPEELGLPDSIKADPWRKVERAIYKLLAAIRVYQFHDTSEMSRIRLPSQTSNSKSLMSDGGNLAAFLNGMRQTPEGERRVSLIERHIQRVMPEFREFDFSENNGVVSLLWRSCGSPEYLLGAHQLSDGSLRYMALATLLLQSPQTLPDVIVIDEPELGLHPYAVAELAGLIKKASLHSQVIVSTQSPILIDQFSVEEIRIVEMSRETGATLVRVVDSRKLADWLREFSLSEAWEKNLLGGRP